MGQRQGTRPARRNGARESRDLPGRWVARGSARYTQVPNYLGAIVPGCKGAAVLFMFVLAAAPARAQTDLQTVVARVSAFVEDFQKNFGLMVAEEHYEQNVRVISNNILLRGRAPLSTAPTRAVLRSDFLLVRSPDGRWLPFRDVFEHNGTPVRDRQDRLAKLFLERQRDALDQAKMIMDESARYNVGTTVSRTINLPTMALDFLIEPHRPRFVFTDAGRDETGRIIAYKEQGSPTYVVTTNNRDLPVTGRFWVDEVTGRVEKTEMRAVDVAVEAYITVTYRTDPASGAWVPGRMEERYLRRGDPNEVRGLATYSNFRRFKVETTEEVVQ